MSVIYNPDPLSRECRLSRFNQRDSRLVFDAQFDYFENVEGMDGLGTLNTYYSKYTNCFGRVPATNSLRG